MSGFLVHGPPVRLCMGVACVLSLWNTGGSRTGCSKFGYSLCFRDWRQPTSQARILNEFDWNGNNKFPISGFVLWLFECKSHLCNRIICILHGYNSCPNHHLLFPGALNQLPASPLVSPWFILTSPSDLFVSHYITFQVLPSCLPTSKIVFNDVLLVFGSYPKSFTPSAWPCSPCLSQFLQSPITCILLFHHCCLFQFFKVILMHISDPGHILLSVHWITPQQVNLLKCHSSFRSQLNVIPGKAFGSLRLHQTPCYTPSKCPSKYLILFVIISWVFISLMSAFPTRLYAPKGWSLYPFIYHTIPASNTLVY